jgi:23S rRNA pseudouridine2605 synthase
VLGVPDAHDLDRLARGVVVDGRRTRPATVELISDRRRPAKKSQGDDTSVIRVTVHEGRTRQVRKMCDAIGHPVRRLRRVRIGPLSDHTLKPGAFRELTNEEIRRLKSAGRTSPSSQRRDAKTQRAKPNLS